MLRKLLCTVMVGAGLGLSASAANAGPIVTDTWYTFCFGSATSPLTAGDACILGTNSPDGDPILVADDPAWTISITGPNQYLIVLDGFLSINQFEMFNNLSSIGTTSAPTPGSDCGSDMTCAWNNLAFSRGTFALPVGDYSFTGDNILDIAGAGFFKVGSLPGAVPEPATLLLMGVGILGLARRQARRARQ